MSLDGPLRLLDLLGWPWYATSSAAGAVLGAVVARWSVAVAGALIALALAVTFFGQLGGFGASWDYVVVGWGSIHFDSRPTGAAGLVSLVLSAFVLGPAVLGIAAGTGVRKLLRRRNP